MSLEMFRISDIGARGQGVLSLPTSRKVERPLCLVRILDSVPNALFVHVKLVMKLCLKKNFFLEANGV